MLKLSFKLTVKINVQKVSERQEKWKQFNCCTSNEYIYVKYRSIIH